MKKILVILIAVVVFLFSSCLNSEKVQESTTVAETVATENTSVDYESNDFIESIIDSGYSSELVAPEYEIPMNYNDIDAYLNLSQSDSSKKNGDTEDFYSGSKKVYQKKYKNGAVSQITIYENDGMTVNSVFDFITEDNGDRAVDIDFYKEGQLLERRKYIYYDNNSIKTVYTHSVDSDGGLIVNVYVYDETGVLVQCINSDDFNQLIMDAILNELANK